MGYSRESDTRDWDAWMKANHIKMPTVDDMKKASEKKPERY